MKKNILRILASAPAVIICSMTLFLDAENNHFGFDNPGINTDALLIGVILSFFSFISASLILFIWHKKKIDFILPYTIYALSLLRLGFIISILMKYYTISRI